MPQKQRPPPRKSHNETVGQRLARFRREKGLSQTEVATKLGVSQATVSAYERDAARLVSDHIVALTSILQVSSDELLGVTPSARKPEAVDRRLLHRLSLIQQLPKRDRDTLMRTINTFLEKLSPSGRQSQKSA